MVWAVIGHGGVVAERVAHRHRESAVRRLAQKIKFNARGVRSSLVLDGPTHRQRRNRPAVVSRVEILSGYSAGQLVTPWP
jgi:hypothetical protein